MLSAAFRRLLVSPSETRGAASGEGNKRARTGYLRELHRRMRDDARLHDIVFIVDGKRFPCHRALVAAASPVLASMLTNGMRETGQAEVELKELDAATWAAVLDYVYTADIRITETNVAINVLECARRFQLVELESDMVAFLAEQLAADNCCAVLAAADTFEISELGECAASILQRNFHEVHSRLAFAGLALDVLEAVVACRELNVRSELDVLVGIVNWLVRNEDVNIEEPPHIAITSNSDTEKMDEAASLADQLLQNVDLSLTTVKQRTRPTPVARALQRYVDVDNLNGQDLKAAAKICHAAKFTTLYEQCVDKLLQLTHPLSTPVHPLERPKHARYAPSFTFQYRLYGISHAVSPDALVDEQDTPWVLDSTGMHRWRLEVEFSRHDQSLSMFLRAQQVEPEANGKVTYQAFVLNADETATAAATKKWTRDVAEFVDSGWGWRDVLPFEKLRYSEHGVVQKSSDSIVVGATIYFLDDNT